MQRLTLEEIRERLDYNPETGDFIWKDHKKVRQPVGSIAGWHNDFGYRVITVGGRNYGAHRLAWLFTHGEWPAEQIDHINRVRNDNRIANLRQADAFLNQQNTKLRKDNTSGYRGVCWHRTYRAWESKIMFNKKLYRLGLFQSAEEAYAAYVEAAKKLHIYSPLSDSRKGE